MYGQYHVIERIAVGGMAEIYLGVAHGVEGFERQVVIKKVRQRFSRDSRFHSMLVKEAKITASLNHPNIVQILDLGQNDREEYFIVMEYVEGKDLRSLMDRTEETGARLDWDQVLYIATEICSALDYAHAKTGDDGRPLRLIHRDVSPSNVLISRAGGVKLTDFGIARYGRDVSVVGSLKGKLAYMAPEQARTEPLDHRCDLFSLGAVMFEALLGRRVYPGETETDLLEQAQQARIPRPSSIDGAIPAELERILLRALAVDPEDRFDTAEEMGTAIRSFQFRHSSRRVTPEQLSNLLGRVFPAEVEAPRARSIQFTISTLVELQDPSFAPERPAAFVEAVTNPGGPSPELLARLRRDDAAPLEPVATREAPPPIFESEEELLTTSRREAARRFPPLEPALAPLAAPAPATDEELEERPTEVAPASGLLQLRASPGEIVRPRDVRSVDGPTAEGPDNLTARVACIASSIDDLLEQSEQGGRVTGPHPLVEQEQPPAAGPEPAAAEPVSAPTEPEHAPEAAPRPALQRPIIAQQSTRILPIETGTHEAPFGAPAPAPQAPPGLSPFAEVDVPRAGPPRRRWGSWLVVALLGLSLGGGAALLLLMPNSPLRGSSTAAVEPEGRADRGKAADASPVVADRSPDASSPDSRVALTTPAGPALAINRPPAERPTVEPRRQPKRPRHTRRGRTRHPTARDDDEPIRVTTPGPKEDEGEEDPPAPSRGGTGQVVIKSDPWAYIHVDGRDTRLTTSARPFTLSAGRHRVELVNPALRLRRTLVIEVEADGVVRRFVRLKD